MPASNCQLILFIQLILETLPISSSTHLWLLNNYLLPASLCANKLDNMASQLLNLPTLFVFAFFFRRQILHLLKEPKQLWQYLKFTLIANFLTGSAYVFCRHFFNVEFAGTTGLLINLGLCSAALFSTKFAPEVPVSHTNLSAHSAILVGLAQCLALFKGFSRFGITFSALTWNRFAAGQAIFVSFMLHSQLCLATFLQQQAWNLDKINELFFADQTTFLCLVVGMLASYQNLHLSYFLARTGRFYYFAFYYLALISIVSLIRFA